MACERPQPWERMKKKVIKLKSFYIFFPLDRQQAVPIDLRPQQWLQALPFPRQERAANGDGSKLPQ